jgi:hypothetical protein
MADDLPLPSYANITTGNYNTGTGTGVPTPPTICTLDKELVTEEIVKVRSICDKVGQDLTVQNVDPAMVGIFSLLNEAILGICSVQEKIVSASPQPSHAATASVIGPEPTGNAKKARNEPSEQSMVDLTTYLRNNPPTGSSQSHRYPDPDPEPVKKFKEAVNKAEKSTVIFNLNLGKIPIVNQDTISTNVTKALTALAVATEENNTGSIPSNNTITALDDALSVVKGMKFFGKKTYSYRKASDPNSGAYCTIPVRYDFEDKEVRQFAETVFRDKCKASCSTPYPTILRECIKQVINQTKAAYPNNFVSVTVDTGKMVLKIARRPMLDKEDRSRKKWVNMEVQVPIPEAALDIHARKVPEGFQIDKIDFPQASTGITDTSGTPDPSTDQEMVLAPNGRSPKTRSPVKR